MSGRSARHVAPASPDQSPRRGPTNRWRGLRQDPVLAVTVLASLGAGVIHAAVAPEHTNWWASVVFFISLASFQLGWAVFLLITNPPRAALMVGAGVNAGALATWAVSRTSGMPFGPHQGVAEPASRADIIASGLGVLVIVGALALARGWAFRPSTGVRPLLSTGAGGLAVSALSVVALTGVSGHAHSIDEHAGHGTSMEAAAATAPLSAAAVLAQCQRTAQVAVDARFAKAVASAGGKPAAIAKAEKAAKKQLKRALAKCAGAPAPAATPGAAQATPHPDDGHSH